MNRREFCRNLALIAAGSALPTQIDAFAKMYEVNSEKFAAASVSDLISIDGFYIGGTAGASSPAKFVLWDGKELVLNLAGNLFGGMISWQRPVHHACFATRSGLRIRSEDGHGGRNSANFNGSLVFTDSNMLVTVVPLSQHKCTNYKEWDNMYAGVGLDHLVKEMALDVQQGIMGGRG